jgi:hypothetical protein
MAIRFIDGFDHYAIGDITSKWSAVALTHGLDLAAGRFGGSALTVRGLDSPANYIFRDFGPGSYSAGVLGFAFKPSTTSAIFLLRLMSGATPQISLQLNSDGTISYSSLTSIPATSFATLAVGVWHYVELVFSISGSIAANSCQIWVDGALYSTLTAGQATNPAGGTTMNRIAIVPDGTGGPVQSYDDLYFLDIDGDTTGPLGECRIEALLPTGAGAHTAWTNTGGSSNWQSAGNTTPDGDTTYVGTATVNDVDSYVTSNLTSTPNTIHGVQVNLWSRKDDASPRSIEAALVIAGTTYTGGDKSLLSSYSDQTTVFRKSPATTAAWTATEVNGMEVGVKLSV